MQDNETVVPVPAQNWQLAALIVLLVVVPGAVEQFEAMAGGTPQGRPVGAAAPSPAARAGRSRHVRPPRGC